MHLREQIRNEAAAAIGGLTSTAGRVHIARVFPLDQHQMPAWVVNTGTEEVSEVAMGGQQARALELIFTGVARATSGAALMSALDSMAAELEAVLLPGAFTAVHELELISTEVDVDADETDQALGAISVTYRATYATSFGAASA
jgi:hypothetical protein